MENTGNLKKCQVFTPDFIVKLILDSIGYRGKEILDKSIIDNSCGNGNFLVEITSRIILIGLENGLSRSKIKKILESNIYGFDIDFYLVKETTNRLNKFAAIYKINNINWKIFCADGLNQDFNFKFDFVVGNPPYISYSNLEIEKRNELRNRFLSCANGKFDYHYAFIEKDLSIVKKNGVVALVTPLNMFKTVSGNTLRNIIKPYLKKIIDLTNQKIFRKVLTSPAVIILKKDILEKEDDLIYSKLNNKGLIEISKLDKREFTNKWSFSSFSNNLPNRFGDNFKVMMSVATLANHIFVLNSNNLGNINIDIEQNILKNAISPQSVKLSKKQKIIFPYTYNENGICHISEDVMWTQFPKAMKYLFTYKNKLLKRDLDKNAKWFEYGRSQALNSLNCEKLLLSNIITNRVKVYKLSADYVPYAGVIILSKNNSSLDEAKNILLSERFLSYIKYIGTKISGSSYRITSKDIENFTY